MFDFLSGTFRTLTGWQWMLLALIPPATVLLYFLKLKRVPLEVPSTYLWHKTIEDLHVNSLWQKLRQNILLFLQLLLLLLAILALLRPSWQGSQLTDERYVFLIDTSASMSAVDVEPTRLEAAKQQLIQLIDQELRPGSVAMVISFSDRAIVEQPFTNNRNLLKRKIAAIMPTQRGSELDEALRVAAGLANPGRSGTEDRDVAAAKAMPATLVILSDGKYRASPNFAMGNLKAQYVSIGKTEATNVGIVAFSSAANPERPEQTQLFGRIQNFGSEDATLTANLVLYNPNRHLLDAAQVTIPPSGTSGVEFTIDTIEDGELRLELDHKDAFPLDNVAFVALNPRQKAQVLVVTPRNDALETVLATEFAAKLADSRIENPDYLKSDSYRAEAEAGIWDLIIFDRCQPESMPRSNTYFIGSLPPDDRWSVAATEELPQIIDTDQAHPLMRFVELGDLRWIVESTPLNVPTGGSVLIESHVGVLLAIAPREGFEDLVQGFSIVDTDDEGARYSNTDWPIRVSFPVFIGNVLSYSGGSGFESAQEYVSPGQPVTLKTVEAAEEVIVQNPTGQRVRVPRGPSNTYIYGQADAVGVYQVEDSSDSGSNQRFAVNLFDANESDVVPAPVVETGYEEVTSSAVWETKRHEGWKYLLIAGLLVLTAEWYIYNRRVYI